MVQPLYVLLLMTLVHGQTPKFARLPDKTGNKLSVWADYSYRVSSIFQNSALYCYNLDVCFAGGFFPYPCCKFDCGGINFSMTMLGAGSPVTWAYYGGNPSWGYGGCGSWSYQSLQYSEMTTSVSYSKTTSPVAASYRMSGGIVLGAISGQTWSVGTGGATNHSFKPIPGPIMGIYFKNSGGDDGFQDQEMWTVHDLAWCQNEQIPSFNIISGTYGYDFQMGTTVTIPVDHTYHSWNFYSTYCRLTMKTLSITHRIHKDETNLSMDSLNIRLWNEQAWMLVNVGTTPKFQILPQRDTCLHNIDDCLPIWELGDKCVVVNPNTQVVLASLPPLWTPNCNQDMTLSNKTDSDSVITYAQNPLSENARGIVKLSTVDPWMEGIHIMRLRIYNAGPYYQDKTTNLPWIQKDMTQDIQFRVRHNCLYTFIQYNTTYKTYQGKIQDMTVPVSTKQYQDLLPCFSHTYAYRWPPNACNIGFQIMTGNQNVMTLVENVLTVSTTNPADVAVWPFQIKVYIKQAPTIFWLLTMKVTITPPCNIVSYVVSTPIPKDIRYVIGLFEEMPLEFSFTFLNTPSDLWQFHWFYSHRHHNWDRNLYNSKFSEHLARFFPCRIAKIPSIGCFVTFDS